MFGATVGRCQRRLLLPHLRHVLVFSANFPTTLSITRPHMTVKVGRCIGLLLRAAPAGGSLDVGSRPVSRCLARAAALPLVAGYAKTWPLPRKGCSFEI